MLKVCNIWSFYTTCEKIRVLYKKTRENDNYDGYKSGMLLDFNKIHNYDEVPENMIISIKDANAFIEKMNLLR